MPPGNSWADATAGAPGIRHCLRGEPDWRTRRRLARLPRAVIPRNLVDHDCDENFPLPRGEFLIHGAAQRGEQIPPLRLLGGAETKPVRQPLPVLGVQPHARVPPKCRPIFADASKMTNLYAHVLNRLSPWNCPILAVMASSASGAAWYARSYSSGPEIRNRGAHRPTSSQAMRTSSSCSRDLPVPVGELQGGQPPGRFGIDSARGDSGLRHGGVNRHHGHDANQRRCLARSRTSHPGRKSEVARPIEITPCA